MRMGEFVVDRLGHDGRGIASWNGKTLFIKGALPGERVSTRLVRDHSRYAEARIDKLLEPSPERVAAPCAHYSSCGGCQLQHLPVDQQLAFKQESVLDQLELWGGVKPRRVLPPITSSDSGYRRCARLGVSYGDSVVLGFRQQNSRQLVNIDSCLVLAPELQRLIQPLKTWLAGLESAGAVTHLELLQTAEVTAVILRHPEPLAPADLAGLQTLAGKQGITIWLQPGEASDLRDLHGQAVNPRLSYALPEFNLSLRFHPQDFIQVNPEVNARMVAQAIELLDLKGDERVLDLFCGIGNFTLPLARRCGQVIGIEAVDAMVARGRENAAAEGITNAEFIAADLLKLTEHRLQQTCGKVDAVLLDPPRDGAKEIITRLAHLSSKGEQLSPRRIVYVSCNPATLARDAKVLAEAGYQLDAAGVLDMFPHTAHVESMALFVRR
jgi:23S rRNA (uracil1939-C5)-methyltransferase